MDRRKFLGSLIGGIAATAAVRSWPFRVYSFPTEIDAFPECVFPDIVRQQLYLTTSTPGSSGYFKVGDWVSIGNFQARIKGVDLTKCLIHLDREVRGVWTTESGEPCR
jgi:hypothetical protein